MKSILEIPEPIAEVFRELPKISREKLQTHCGISEYEAKIYTYLWNHGKTIQYHETRLKPKGGKIKAAFLIGDLQIPYHDELAINRMLDWGLSKNPDQVILGGDIFDFYAISVFRKDPREPKIGDEIKLGRDYFYELDEKISKCKSVKEKIFIEGNHEARWLAELQRNNQTIAQVDVLQKYITVPYIYGLHKIGWDYISNVDALTNGLQVFKLGKLPIIHGHEVRLRGGQLLNIARWYYLACRTNILLFHYHVHDEKTFKKLDHSYEGAWVVGCACHTLDYAPKNDWVQGFAMVYWTENDFSVHNKKYINGKVL